VSITIYARIERHDLLPVLENVNKTDPFLEIDPQAKGLPVAQPSFNALASTHHCILISNDTISERISSNYLTSERVKSILCRVRPMFFGV
jgi:hypothetical protein